MRRSIILLIAVALVVAGCAADDGSQATDPTNSTPAYPWTESGVRTSSLTTVNNGSGTGITVSGIGEVTGTPDTLTLTIGVSVLRNSVTQAIDDAADLADGLLTRLREFGVADEDLQTSNFSVYPEYDWRNDERRLIGYRVSNQLSVKIRDLDRAGEIVDAAAREAGDELVVNGVSFSIDDNEAMIEAAREAAWSNAYAKASQLAELAGVTLGAPVSISETYSPSPSPIVYAERLMAAADSSTPIEPGSQQVTVSLTVVFSIG